MSILVLLIFASLAIATTFLFAFIWAVRSGQYEDTCTPAMRVLMEDTSPAGTPPRDGLKKNHGAVSSAQAPPPRNALKVHLPLAGGAVVAPLDPDPDPALKPPA